MYVDKSNWSTVCVSLVGEPLDVYVPIVNTRQQTGADMDAITALRKERSNLLERLKKIDKAISEYEAWAAGVSGLIDSAHITAGSPIQENGETPKAGGTPPARAEPRVAGSPIDEFEAAVRAILGSADNPLQRGPLLEALTEHNIVVVGQVPANTMGTRLSRMKDVVNLKGHGYWLRERDFPRAGHSSNPNETASEPQAGNLF